MRHAVGANPSAEFRLQHAPDVVGHGVGGLGGIDDAEAAGMLAGQGEVALAHEAVEIEGLGFEAAFVDGAAGFDVARQGAAQALFGVDVEQEGVLRPGAGHGHVV